MEWYYAKDGRSFGPVPEQSIRAWLESGFLRPTDLLWRSGLDEWTRASELPEFSRTGGAPTPGIPGTIPVPPPAGYPGYAGFWLRAGAYFIDILLLSMVLLIFFRPQVSPNMDMDQLLEVMRRFQSDTRLMAAQFFLAWFYFALLESSPWQATLGKKAFRLRVTDLNGQRLSFFRASFRHFAKILSELTFLIGFLLAGFTPRKQALHDLIGRCLVVRH